MLFLRPKLPQKSFLGNSKNMSGKFPTTIKVRNKKKFPLTYAF